MSFHLWSKKNVVEFANTYIQAFHKCINYPSVNISLALWESFFSSCLVKKHGQDNKEIKLRFKEK